MNRIRFISLLSIFLCLLIAVPMVSASDNQTAIVINETVQEPYGAIDYYFDSNIEDDTGNGTLDNPYRELTPDRINDNNVIHLSEGEYSLGSVNCENLTFIGQDSSLTILANGSLTFSSKLNLVGICLKNVTINNMGNIEAYDSIINLDNGKHNLGKINGSSSTIIGQNLLKTILTGGKLTIPRYYTFNLVNITTNGFEIENNGNLYAANAVLNWANGNYALGGLESDNVTINGKKTVFDGGVLTVSSSVALNGVTLNKVRISNSGNITARNTVFNSSSASQGGAIYSGENTIIDLVNCTFSNNKATSFGGAIYINGGVLKIADSLFENNVATYFGGAIASQNSAVTIKKSKFIKDMSLKDAGGAIYLVKSNLTANDMEIANSNATFGGSIAALNSTLKLTSIDARGNTASYDGGAIYQMYGSLYLVKSSFSDNIARNGGALLIDDINGLTVKNNVFTSNKASDAAGAVYSIASESISSKKFNNTYSGNAAPIENDLYECELPAVTIGNNNYIMVNYDYSYSGKLPSSYDLRNLNQVTPVKNQGSGGNCWSFSSTAALESAILKATGTAYDLSEENMKNVMSLYSDYGWKMETNVGGYDKMGVGYLTSWLGPIVEDDDAYSPISVLSSVSDSIFHVQNILYLTRTDYTDNDAIKRAIIEHGAVSTSVYWGGSSYIKNSKNYFYNGSLGANHAVAIVGWDDNYSKSNFRTTPEGNGAWIIKNSWGTYSGDKGYYYVSYYDTRLAPTNKSESTYVFVLNDSIKYNRNYQYDIPGKTDYFLNSSSTVWYKNTFTAVDNEYLAAVSTYFEKETSWDLSVFVNGIHKLTQSGKSQASYSTIELNQLIPLNIGDVFEIVFKITVNGDAGVPISEKVSLNKMFYHENISYVSYDGENWADLFDLEWKYSSHTYDSQVACIKAFTISEEADTTISLRVTSATNPVEITATVLTEGGNPVKSGKVTFTVAGKGYAVDVKDGISKFTYLFSNSNNVVSATFNGIGFKNSSSKISVSPKQVSIKASNFVSYYNKTLQYSAALTDSDGKFVAGKELKFKVNNKEYIAKTNEKGVATVTVNLPAGVYDVVIGFNDLSGYSKFDVTKKMTIKTTVVLPASSKYTYNSKYPISLIDRQGNPLTYWDFDFIIDGVTDIISTNSKGINNYNIDLKPGSYKISIINPESDEVVSQKIQVVSRITQNKDLTMYYGAGSYYKVKVLDNNGNVAKNVKVTFKINGKTYYRYTNANGYASLKIGLKPGKYTVKATYKGFTVLNRITVKSTIVTKDITVKKGKTIKFTAKLLSSKGKIIKNKKITFKFKGKTYKVKTNKKGIATLKVTKRYAVGKYTITSSYGKLKIKNRITIKK